MPDFESYFPDGSAGRYTRGTSGAGECSRAGAGTERNRHSSGTTAHRRGATCAEMSVFGRYRGRPLATRRALERGKGGAGLSPGRPPGHRQPVADLRRPVAHEA